MLLAAGCVRSERTGSEPETYRLTWDFVETPQPVLLSLWPAQQEAPERLKRHLRTNQHEGRLRLQVDGIDPGFIWQFADRPLKAGAMRLDIWSAEPQDVQLFWAGTRCRAFKEECSTIAHVPAERHVVEFLLPPEPLAELRLDFGQRAGLRLEIHQLVVFEQPVLHEGWRPLTPSTTVAESEDGLVVNASDIDPWVVTDTPGISASLLDTLELVLDAPEGARPQVFWRGSECLHFNERCSAWLEPLEGGLTATSVDLGDVATWRGQIDGLRVDPGDRAGRYVIARVGLEKVSGISVP